MVPCLLSLLSGRHARPHSFRPCHWERLEEQALLQKVIGFPCPCLPCSWWEVRQVSPFLLNPQMSCRGERREQVVGHSAQHMLGVNEIFLELQLPNHWLIFFFETIPLMASCTAFASTSTSRGTCSLSLSNLPLRAVRTGQMWKSVVNSWLARFCRKETPDVILSTNSQIMYTHFVL
jgi:hypothetical protein